MADAGTITNRFASRDATLERVLLGALGLAFLFALAVLCLGLFQPLLDQYFARQTQTALTTYWLMRGGPILAYETPVLGFPWSIPLEFPLYQLIVAALASAGVPLDAAGRIVSFAFFVGCLWPMHVLFRALRFDNLAFLCVSILFLLCPLYVYWGRTFMIETCALFFCLCWLAYFARYLADPRAAFAMIAALAGSLGILAKSTTFPAFGMLGGLLLLKQSHAAWKSGFTADKVRPILLAAFALALPLIVGIAWTAYSDIVKAGNEVGALLTSRRLVTWTLGTLDQRIGLTLWRDVILRRSLTDAFGNAAVPAVALIGATLLRRQYAYAALAALLAFLAAFLMFTNLHIIHFYYQTANAIFIVAAAGLGLACVMRTKQVVLGFVCLALIVAGQLFYFRSNYAYLLTNDFSLVPQFRIAQVAKSATKLDDSLIIIGDDWSSTIPYYAERKSLVIPNWIPVSSWQRMLATPQKYLDDVRLGGVVYCGDTAPQDAERKALVDAFLAGRAVLGEVGGCSLFAPEKN